MKKRVPIRFWHLSIASILIITYALSWKVNVFTPKTPLSKNLTPESASTANLMPPDPQISGNAFPCPNSEETYSVALTAGNTYVWTLSSGGVILGQNGSSVDVLWSNTQGSGPHSLIVTETDMLGDMASDTLTVFIQNVVMACNDTVQVSLDETGVAEVTPDMILEGTYNSYDIFTVEIRDNFGRNLGNTVSCTYAGRALRVTVTNGCDQNSCWSTIIVEDKIGPEFTCPEDEIVLECYENPDAVPFPVAIDNCDPTPIVNLTLEEEDTNDVCTERLITRTFIAVDRYGNQSEPCIQLIRILPSPEPTFPDDITWTCEQYKAFPNVINATALHRCLRENAAAMDLANLNCIPGLDGDDITDVDPYETDSEYWTDGEDLDVTLNPFYDDNIDNPLTDPNPNNYNGGSPIFSTFGNPSAETDNNPAFCNLSLGLCPYFDTLINTTPHIPDTILTPIFRTGPDIQGLEDADVLEMTGSGVPNVFGSNCSYSVNYSDQKLTACDGLDTTMAFKILRTWTVLSWCTGEIYTDIQIIKVVDRLPPTVIREPFSVNANLAAVGPHGECTSTEILLPPIVKDNCSDTWTIKIFTTAGEAIYLNSTDGKSGGYIPAPGLPLGIHIVRYVVTDACGNRTEIPVEVTVIDDSVPVMVCTEVTDVGLTIDGTARVCAQALDAGSYDNCGIDSFLVKRMNEPDSLFKPCIVFDCDDDTVMVIVRAVDYSGNTNDCMVEVQVNDKLRPQCDAPDDVWTTCVDIPDYADLSDTTVLRDLFGEATAYDNCNAWIRELAPTLNVNQCGIGTIIRNFRAYDENGQVSLGACRQVITIKEAFDYTIHFPADWTGQCGDLEDAPDVTFTKGTCDVIAVNYSDLRFDISSDGACYKIIRTWQVMNWCAYDGTSLPIPVPHRVNGDSITEETYDAHGYYEYKQIIKVTDTKAPVLSYSGPVEFCGGYTQDCIGDVNILPDIDEECTIDLTVKWRLDAYNDGTLDGMGDNALKRALPLGKHKVTFEVTDGCGNKSQIAILFEVRDCKKPTPVCINGLSTDLMQTGDITLKATDFERQSSFDQCTPYNALKFRINRITDRNGDGLITPADYINTVPPHDTVTFKCRDLGINNVQVWVGDAYNNWDYCVTFVDIQDNMLMCPTGSKMGGRIATERGDGVQDVKVDLNGISPRSMMTSQNGMFGFNNVPRDYDYTLAPYKNDDAVNGVSTFDLATIVKHILRTELLDSPYKIIAADANRSNSVTTLDLVELRKLILRTQNSFRNNTSWRFIDKNYQFPNPADPFSHPFREIINFNDLSTDELHADFIAVKIGDINFNARTTNATTTGNRTYPAHVALITENRTFEAGEMVSVLFTISKEDMAGYQFTLDFDKEVFDFIDFGSNEKIKEENFGFALLDEGAITTSWNDPSGELTDDKELTFELIFQAKRAGQLANTLGISSRFTLAEAYKKDGEPLGIQLKFGEISQPSALFELYQNKPNPFSKQTIISFNLPEASTATLTVFNLSGKVLNQVRKEWTSGYHEIGISRETIGGSGIYYYRLETPKHTATRKMVIAD